jgi:pimeloyl-ACP methyl ester carboxylesterase
VIEVDTGRDSRVVDADRDRRLVDADRDRRLVDADRDRRLVDADRARLPDETGRVTRPDGVRIAYEVYGLGDPTLVFLPSTPIVHSRQWKGQVPYLSRHYRVVTFDGRGNGRSDRPTEPDAYREERIVGDIEGVMDATGTHAAVLVGLCSDSVWRAIELASSKPDRVLGIVAFAVGVPLLTPPHPWRVKWSFEDELPTDEGWAKVNRHYFRRDYPGFAHFFFQEITSEPHSTKQIEDAVEWATDGSVDAMIADAEVDQDYDLASVEATCRAVRCPMLLIHGTEDSCQPLSRAQRLSELTGAPLVVVEGADHMIPGRHPVLANLLIRDFVRSLPSSEIS